VFVLAAKSRFILWAGPGWDILSIAHCARILLSGRTQVVTSPEPGICHCSPSPRGRVHRLVSLVSRSLDYGLAGLAGPSTIDPSAATESETATRVGGGRPRFGR
jgi:hypothetical protein